MFFLVSEVDKFWTKLTSFHETLQERRQFREDVIQYTLNFEALVTANNIIYNIVK
jgi:hypothetical protein